MATRVGLVGAGMVARLHADALRRMHDIIIQCVCSRSLKSAANLAQEYGIQKIYPSWEALIKSGDVDAVHILVPNNLHKEVFEACVAHNLEVVCEKPLATRIEDALQMYRLAQESKVKTTIVFNYRFIPMLMYSKHIVQSGELGELRHVFGRIYQDWLSSPMAYNWRVSGIEGGPLRVMGDLGCHIFDLIEWITGRKVMELAANAKTLIPQRKAADGRSAKTFSNTILESTNYGRTIDVDTEDFISVEFNMELGVVGLVVLSQVATGRRFFMELEISGEKGSVYWSSDRFNELSVYSEKGQITTYTKDFRLLTPDVKQAITLPGNLPEGFNETFLGLLDAFYQGKSSMHNVVPSLEDGVEQVAIYHAALESAKSGRWTEVSRPW